MSDITYRWAAASDVGRSRDNNQDSLFPLGSGSGPGPLIFAVADGLGGLEAGEVASRLAIEAATAAPADDEAVSLVDRLKAGHDAVVEFVLGSPDVIESATTLTLARVDVDGMLEVAHVGDSRLYASGDEVFYRVTTDQTVAQRKLDAGEISELEATLDPGRHILTSACGLDDLNIQHLAGIQLGPGERILLCSDGLTEMVSDGEIGWVLAGQSDPSETVTWLIDAANSAGGVDNITVIVVTVEAAAPEPVRPDFPGWEKEHGIDHADFLDALHNPDDPLHEVALRSSRPGSE